MKIYMCSSYEWMHEGQRVPWAPHTRARRPDLKYGGKRVDDGGTPSHWPLSHAMIPYHWPDQTELPVQVAMATGAHRETGQLLWDKIFPFPQATECLSSSFVYSSSATGPTACTSCHDLFKCTSLLWRLIKTLHGTSDVIVYTGTSVFTA